MTVEPSIRINAGLGIFVRVNEYHEIDGSDSGGRARLLGNLEDGFNSSLKRSEKLIDHIMSLATDPT